MLRPASSPELEEAVQVTACLVPWPEGLLDCSFRCPHSHGSDLGAPYCRKTYKTQVFSFGSLSMV